MRINYFITCHSYLCHSCFVIPHAVTSTKLLQNCYWILSCEVYLGLPSFVDLITLFVWAAMSKAKRCFSFLGYCPSCQKSTNDWLVFQERYKNWQHKVLPLDFITVISVPGTASVTFSQIYIKIRWLMGFSPAKNGFAHALKLNLLKDKLFAQLT